MENRVSSYWYSEETRDAKKFQEYVYSFRKDKREINQVERAKNIDQESRKENKLQISKVSFD